MSKDEDEPATNEEIVERDSFTPVDTPQELASVSLATESLSPYSTDSALRGNKVFRNTL